MNASSVSTGTSITQTGQQSPVAATLSKHDLDHFKSAVQTRYLVAIAEWLDKHAQDPTKVRLDDDLVDELELALVDGERRGLHAGTRLKVIEKSMVDIGNWLDRDASARQKPRGVGPEYVFDGLYRALEGKQYGRVMYFCTHQWSADADPLLLTVLRNHLRGRFNESQDIQHMVHQLAAMDLYTWCQTGDWASIERCLKELDPTAPMWQKAVDRLELAVGQQVLEQSDGQGTLPAHVRFVDGWLTSHAAAFKDSRGVAAHAGCSLEQALRAAFEQGRYGAVLRFCTHPPPASDERERCFAVLREAIKGLEPRSVAARSIGRALDAPELQLEAIRRRDWDAVSSWLDRCRPRSLNLPRSVAFELEVALHEHREDVELGLVRGDVWPSRQVAKVEAWLDAHAKTTVSQRGYPGGPSLAQGSYQRNFDMACSENKLAAILYHFTREFPLFSIGSELALLRGLGKDLVAANMHSEAALFDHVHSMLGYQKEVKWIGQRDWRNIRLWLATLPPTAKLPGKLMKALEVALVEFQQGADAANSSGHSDVQASGRAWARLLLPADLILKCDWKDLSARLDKAARVAGSLPQAVLDELEAVIVDAPATAEVWALADRVEEIQYDRLRHPGTDTAASPIAPRARPETGLPLVLGAGNDHQIAAQLATCTHENVVAFCRANAKLRASAQPARRLPLAFLAVYRYVRELKQQRTERAQVQAEEIVRILAADGAPQRSDGKELINTAAFKVDGKSDREISSMLGRAVEDEKWIDLLLFCAANAKLVSERPSAFSAVKTWLTGTANSDTERLFANSIDQLVGARLKL